MRLFFVHTALCLLLAGQCACCALMPRRPPGGGPFLHSLPVLSKESGLGAPWVFWAGLVMGLCLALFWRRLRFHKSLKNKNALWRKWGSRDTSHLEAALDLLNEVAQNWRRTKTVVRLSRWMAEKGRSDKKPAEKF